MTGAYAAIQVHQPERALSIFHEMQRQKWSHQRNFLVGSTSAQVLKDKKTPRSQLSSVSAGLQGGFRVLHWAPAALLCCRAAFTRCCWSTAPTHTLLRDPARVCLIWETSLDKLGGRLIFKGTKGVKTNNVSVSTQKGLLILENWAIFSHFIYFFCATKIPTETQLKHFNKYPKCPNSNQ